MDAGSKQSPNTPQKSVRKKPNPSVRKPRTDQFHWGVASLAAGLLLTIVGLVAALIGQDVLVALAAGLVFILIMVLLVWLFMAGWRLRNPFHLLPRPEPPKTRTPAEEARREATRQIKSEMTQLFHAKARPAVSRIRDILGGLATEMQERPNPYFTTGQMVETHLLRGIEEQESKLRRVLEGVFWEEREKGELGALDAFIAERDLDKQKPDDFGHEFYLYYGDYRILWAFVMRLSTMLDKDIEQDSRYLAWQGLDYELTTRLRELLARNPALVGFRADFEDMINRKSS